MLGAIWWILTSPIRVLAWLVIQLGRIASVSVGFVLMVLGVALGASTFYILALPLFIVGLLLTFKALR